MLSRGVPGAAGAWLRLVLGGLCALVAAVDGHAALVLPGTVALVLTELASRATVRPKVVVGLSASVAATTVGVSIGETPAALPLLLFAAFRAGELLGVRQVLVERALTGLVTLVLALLTAPMAALPEAMTSVVQWWALGLGLGLLTRWSHREQGASVDQRQQDAAREAARLSGRLQRVARDLPLGLDAAAVAQTLLDEVNALVDVDVCALLLRVDDETASPLALRGASRLPWRDPIRSQGPLNEAWTAQCLTSDVREPDENGRRRGSSMLCVPVWQDRRTMTALLVLQRHRPEEFSSEDAVLVQQAAAWSAPQLQAALHFGELQRAASVFEREQLAREMHDGVAQDLAYVGFGLDALARMVGDDGAVAGDVRSLREEVTRMLADIRLSIGDLRVGVRSDHGLGRVLSAQLQQFGATTGSAVQVELRESTVRLSTVVEHALARLSHELLLDARSGRAGTVRVVLDTEPPSATFVLEHDGAGAWSPSPTTVAVLAGLGGGLQVVVGEKGGLAVVVRFGTPATATTPRLELVDGLGAA